MGQDQHRSLSKYEGGSDGHIPLTVELVVGPHKYIPRIVFLDGFLGLQEAIVSEQDENSSVNVHADENLEEYGLVVFSTVLTSFHESDLLDHNGDHDVGDGDPGSE